MHIIVTVIIDTSEQDVDCLGTCDEDDSICSFSENESEMLYSDSTSLPDPQQTRTCNTEDDIESDIESDYDDDITESDVNEATVDGKDTSAPIYEGAEVTIFESYILAFQFSVRHSLTKKAFSELLQLMSVLLPKSASFPTNITTVKRFLLKLFPHVSPVVHKYCTNCLSVVQSDVSGTCAKDGCYSVSTEQFITIPLGHQIKKMMEGMLSKLCIDACMCIFVFVS